MRVLPLPLIAWMPALSHASIRTRAVSVVVLSAIGLAACTESGAHEARPAASTTTSSTSTSTTSTTVAPTTTTTGVPIAPGLARGSKGEEVRKLEERLSALKYDAGKVDGSFDAATGHAVMAFQKVHGLARTSRATDDVVAKLATAGDPDPLLPSGGANRVEVDLKRQVLFLYKDGALNRIISVSTGSGKRYCVDGDCAKAVTPGGSFRITRRINGWRTSRLGKLYNPLYFNGGIAIHGAPSVPGYPASHGCVRIPMNTAEWFPKAAPNGIAVYVVGGPKAPVPFNEPAPGEAPPTTSPAPPPTSAPTSTTTAAPPPTSTTTTTAPRPPSSTTSTTAKPPTP